MDEKKLPEGTILRDSSTAAISTAKPLGDNVYAFDAPEMIGIQVQVQHPTKTGKPLTRDPGLVGCGVSVSENGVNFLVQIGHNDGTALMAVMSDSELVSYVDCLMQTLRTAKAAMPQGNA